MVPVSAGRHHVIGPCNITTISNNENTYIFPTSSVNFAMSESDAGFQAALEEAKQGAKEGGIPIGACLVDGKGKILGRGHNMRLQKGSAILHVCSVSQPHARACSDYKHTHTNFCVTTSIKVTRLTLVQG